MSQTILGNILKREDCISNIIRINKRFKYTVVFIYVGNYKNYIE